MSALYIGSYIYSNEELFYGEAMKNCLVVRSEMIWASPCYTDPDAAAEQSMFVWSFQLGQFRVLSGYRRDTWYGLFES